MGQRPPTTDPHVERPGPAEFRDPLVRREMAKAAVWLGMALAIAGVIVLGQPLLLIIGGAVPWENIGGRAEFITFSLDGTTEFWNPVSWFESLRSGRAGRSLRKE